MTQSITAVCPADLLNDAEHFAMVIGGGPEHAGTFRNLNWQLATGELCAATNFPGGQWRVDLAVATLDRPEWDDDPEGYVVNMAAANRMQDAMALWHPGLEGTARPQAAADKLTVYIGLGPHEALALMGVSMVPADNAMPSVQ